MLPSFMFYVFVNFLKVKGHGEFANDFNQLTKGFVIGFNMRNQ